MAKKEISFSDIFHALLGHIIFILITALIFGMMAFAYTKAFIKPMYTTHITLLAVSNPIQDVSSITIGELNSSAQLATTYAQVLKSSNVMNDVSAELEKKNLHYSSGQLRGMVSTATTSTQVFNVNVTATSPSDAKTIADVIADVASVKIVEIIGSGGVRIIDYAPYVGSPSSPNVSENTALGVTIGLLLACAVVIIRSLTDSTIWSEEDVTKQFDIPILGTVPQLSFPEKQTGEKEQK